MMKLTEGKNNQEGFDLLSQNPVSFGVCWVSLTSAETCRSGYQTVIVACVHLFGFWQQYSDKVFKSDIYIYQQE